MMDDLHATISRHVDALAIPAGATPPAGAAPVRLLLYAIPRVGVEGADGRDDRPGDPGRPLGAAAVRRRFVVLTALRWLPTGLLIPVLVVFEQSRGLTLAQVGLVSATAGVVVLLLELPTGGLADALGRRPVLVAATALDLASLGLLVARGRRGRSWPPRRSRASTGRWTPARSRPGTSTPA